MLHQLAQQQARQRAHDLPRPRLDATSEPRRCRPATAARLQAGLGWLMVDLGLRLATRRAARQDGPYAHASARARG
jgi:hypothetical protein